MLFLKKLSSAEESGDHIYGVILATGENHGGRANSLTAPNPKAQAELLRSAYSAAGIDPRTVSYIEAHGTGTELGDPIEINGLKSAFSELSEATEDSGVEAGHCGLGSVKTNIGHLELAAGVAGVIKVLLQLQHKRLVKSLHCDEINPYIQLQESPFYIVQESQDWKAFQDDEGNALPRRAGVSSFGFGGANAHVVIEEYIGNGEGSRHPPSRRSYGETGNLKGPGPHLIVLSAKTDERLTAYAKELYEYVENEMVNNRSSLIDLTDLAYTLQLGRDAMDVRVGAIVRSLEELSVKLKSFLAGDAEIADFYRGHVRRDKESVAALGTDEEVDEMVKQWLDENRNSKLLAAWVKGVAFDWNRLYGKSSFRRISLPTYPFSQDRYWVSVKEWPVEGERLAKNLHPLVHENTSTFDEQRFSSTFTGEEFFLKEARDSGQKVLPGMAYLEIARAAFWHASREVAVKDDAFIQLKNVVWVDSIVAKDDSLPIHIGLFPEANGRLGYEIYSETKGEKVETEAGV